MDVLEKGFDAKGSFIGKGHVKIEIFDRYGKLVKQREDHNLIVKVGRAMLLKVLAGLERSAIMKMGVGSGGTADLGENAFNPLEPQESDITLTPLVSVKDIASRTFDDSGKNPTVTFVGLFPSSEVDALVNECGLFFDDGETMFARHTFDTTSLRESSGFKMQITWTVEF